MAESSLFDLTRLTWYG